ncbi:BgTH12-07065 [Blumeria graminis f. sp. triticale]|uniref:BgTH12-07065 n=1 Tax=Blumeria graminis f. sp. triticale TaxID=1689686 RepID=A0A9W4GJP9_BLUGR|nr:BgTH12-07065 [Blumeria graminis f. sp. triticale]
MTSLSPKVVPSSLVTTLSEPNPIPENPINVDPEQSSRKITSYFSQSQLALAFVIQKSKPNHYTTAEYCQFLRQHIKEGKPTSCKELRYVDSVDFWKDQYNKIYIKNKKLEEKIQFFDSFQDLSPDRGKNDHESLSMNDYVRRILNGANPRACPNLRRSKKRPAVLRDSVILGVQRGRDAFDNDLTLKLCILRIRRQRNLLGQIVLNIETLDHINLLARQITKILDIIDNVLIDCCHSCQFIKVDAENPQILTLFQHIMNQTTQSISCCFDGLNKLCSTHISNSNARQITYRVVTFFSNSLKLLHEIGHIQAKNEIVQSRSIRGKRVRQMNSEYVVNKDLASCLTYILKSIDWKPNNPYHSDLLEGILFSILEHTGRLVSEAVFSEHVAASDYQGKMTKDTLHFNEDFVRFEAIYIVQILQAALGGSKNRLLIAEVLAAGSSLNDDQCASQSSSLSDNLLLKTNMLLQGTLVKSAVGSNDLEGLRLPVPPIEKSRSEYSEGLPVNGYGSEWLLETVWKLVGWDLVT